jgi:organic hydroperoxide reductase OsmC/OhrA
VRVYPLTLRWAGNLQDAEYPRLAQASVEGKPTLDLSSGEGPGALTDRWNPEDLLGASLAWCHTLTFLALAKKVGLDVRQVEDQVEVVLDAVDKQTQVTVIRLAPRIYVGPGTPPERVVLFYEKAHKYCFIANSIKASVEMNPTVIAVD